MVQRGQKVEIRCAMIGKQINLLVLLLCLVSPAVYAQKPVLALTCDQKMVAPKEHLTITVTCNVESSMKVDYPVEFAADYGIMHGMEQKMDPSGKLKTFYYMQQSGEFRKEGTYSFYAYVNFKGKTYKSNKLTIVVTKKAEQDDTKIASNDPVFGIIQAKKTVIYEGEPILVKAKVFSRLGIDHMEGYTPFSPDNNAEQHEFPNQREYVEETKLNGKPALTFEIGKQLIIPIATGKCKIQPFEMALQCQGPLFSRSIRFKSSSLTLIVKPLPSNAPADFIGGVGKFTLSESFGEKNVQQGEVFTLKLVVSGSGNLHNINAPLLKLPVGCMIYGDPERTDEVQFTEDGVTGTVTFAYNILLKEPGTKVIAAPSISYFDPVKEQYITLKSEGFVLDVAPNKTFQPLAHHGNQAKNGHSDALSIATVEKEDESLNSTSVVNLLIGIVAPISGLGLLFLGLILLKNRKMRQSSITESNEHFVQPSPLNLPNSTSTVNFWQAAKDNLSDKNRFAVMLPKAIIQSVENKYGCCFSSREAAFSALEAKNPDSASQLRELINKCDLYRYGFENEDIDPYSLYNEALLLMDRL